MDAKNFSEKIETPFVLIVCNKFLNILDFDAIINESIKWDQNQWKVPPGKLARSIILTPFLRVGEMLEKQNSCTMIGGRTRRPRYE